MEQSNSHGPKLVRQSQRLQSKRRPNPTAKTSDLPSTTTVCWTKSGRIWKPHPRNAPVPLPSVESLSSSLHQCKVPRSILVAEQYQEEDFARLAALWDCYAPRFTLPINLQELWARPKPCQADREAAEVKMNAMEAWPSDPFSGIWQDETGQTMVAVFSSRLITDSTSNGEAIPYITGPLGHPGRTLHDLANISSAALHQDGFPPDKIRRFEEATQILHAWVHPISHKRDGRHDEHKKVIRLPDPDSLEEFRAPSLLPGLDDDIPDIYPTTRPMAPEGRAHHFERVGVTHLVHCWQEQGHPGSFSLSRDFVCGAKAAQAVQYYYRATSGMAKCLAAMFKVAFPAYYEKYSKAFAAGVWDLDDPGPWLGRAIVYKMQVLPHRDGLDDGPTATFPFGYYTGGEMYFPDLGLKLSYRPGDVIIAFAGALYHGVGSWEPQVDNSAIARGITPGRVAHVFFFPQKSFDFLQDKPPHWATDTLQGTCPSARETKRGGRMEEMV